MAEGARGRRQRRGHRELIDKSGVTYSILAIYGLVTHLYPVLGVSSFPGHSSLRNSSIENVFCNASPDDPELDQISRLILGTWPDPPRSGTVDLGSSASVHDFSEAMAAAARRLGQPLADIDDDVRAIGNAQTLSEILKAGNELTAKYGFVVEFPETYSGYPDSTPVDTTVLSDVRAGFVGLASALRLLPVNTVRNTGLRKVVIVKQLRKETIETGPAVTDEKHDFDVPRDARRNFVDSPEGVANGVTHTVAVELEAIRELPSVLLHELGHLWWDRLSSFTKDLDCELFDEINDALPYNPGKDRAAKENRTKARTSGNRISDYADTNDRERTAEDFMHLSSGRMPLAAQGHFAEKSVNSLATFLEMDTPGLGRYFKVFQASLGYPTDDVLAGDALRCLWGDDRFKQIEPPSLRNLDQLLAAPEAHGFQAVRNHDDTVRRLQAIAEPADLPVTVKGTRIGTMSVAPPTYYLSDCQAVRNFRQRIDFHSTLDDWEVVDMTYRSPFQPDPDATADNPRLRETVIGYPADITGGHGNIEFESKTVGELPFVLTLRNPRGRQVSLEVSVGIGETPSADIGPLRAHPLRTASKAVARHL
jgi:hypothetical protein